MLFYHPTFAKKSLKENFSKLEWEKDPDPFSKWTRGLTGYPMVDAGMRELWETGYMHNRVRMIVASFLVKHLLQPWQKGADWFLNTLVDADEANNALGWQWIAGTGTGSSPFFRIFNPITQGKKFDPDGEYIKRWVPELRGVPKEYIHDMTEAPSSVLNTAGVELGKNYPYPIVEHKEARQRALERYEKIK
ncbi:FAD-binding domain-containing protein [Bacillus coahuilensis]|uniref:FAD-binding domain-containing protein n=1 Tax=Bacillus coahuilensis TaxID=408580 RepID=UPI000682D66F|nr:FAD-binding domain-containing protein [Bacillus coahuilensis]